VKHNSLPGLHVAKLVIYAGYAAALIGLFYGNFYVVIVAIAISLGARKAVKIAAWQQKAQVAVQKEADLRNDLKSQGWSAEEIENEMAHLHSEANVMVDRSEKIAEIRRSIQDKHDLMERYERRGQYSRVQSVRGEVAVLESQLRELGA